MMSTIAILTLGAIIWFLAIAIVYIVRNSNVTLEINKKPRENPFIKDENVFGEKSSFTINLVIKDWNEVDLDQIADFSMSLEDLIKHDKNLKKEKGKKKSPRQKDEEETSEDRVIENNTSEKEGENNEDHYLAEEEIIK